MEQMYDKLNLTARTYHKILRVARTLADMDESEQIKMSHLNEALCYRNIDKKFWEGSAYHGAGGCGRGGAMVLDAL